MHFKRSAYAALQGPPCKPAAWKFAGGKVAERRKKEAKKGPKDVLRQIQESSLQPSASDPVQSIQSSLLESPRAPLPLPRPLPGAQPSVPSGRRKSPAKAARPSTEPAAQLAGAVSGLHGLEKATDHARDASDGGSGAHLWAAHWRSALAAAREGFPDLDMPLQKVTGIAVGQAR